MLIILDLGLVDSEGSLVIVQLLLQQLELAHGQLVQLDLLGGLGHRDFALQQVSDSAKGFDVSDNQRLLLLSANFMKLEVQARAALHPLIVDLGFQVSLLQREEFSQLLAQVHDQSCHLGQAFHRGLVSLAAAMWRRLAEVPHQPPKGQSRGSYRHGSKLLPGLVRALVDEVGQDLLGAEVVIRQHTAVPAILGDMVLQQG